MSYTRRYANWRTDKPKEEGFSHELISADSQRLIELTGTNLDSLEGLQFPGVDTLQKAVARTAQLHGDREWMGTRNGDKYEWITYKDGFEKAKMLSLGIVALGMAPVTQAEG